MAISTQNTTVYSQKESQHTYNNRKNSNHNIDLVHFSIRVSYMYITVSVPMQVKSMMYIGMYST
jgi:hypothetical protein